MSKGKTKKSNKHITKNQINFISEENGEKILELKNEENNKVTVATNENNDLRFKVSLITFIFGIMYISQYIIPLEISLQLFFTGSRTYSIFSNKDFFFLMMVFYYISIIVYEKTLNSLKSVILNVIGMIGFYNLLLSYNPLSMVEISSDYFISNILYLYLSFLLFSLDFNISKKLIFLIDIIVVFLNKIKTISKIKVVLLILLIGMFIRYCMKNNGELIIPIITLSTLSIFIILFKEKISYKDTDNYLKLRDQLGELRKFEYLEKIIEWILEIFKIEKLKPLKSTNGKDKLNKINIFFIVFVKYIMPYNILLMYYEFNYEYYNMYKISNGNYCIIAEDKIKNENVQIIKLKNGNILKPREKVEYIDVEMYGNIVKKPKTNHYLTEQSCEKEKINIKY